MRAFLVFCPFKRGKKLLKSFVLKKIMFIWVETKKKEKGGRRETVRKYKEFYGQNTRQLGYFSRKR